MRAFRRASGGFVFTLVSIAAVSVHITFAADFAPTGNPKSGSEVFARKGCISCHAVRGVGGKRGPDLAAFLVNKGIFAVAAGMWSHAPAMKREMRVAKAEFPTLSPNEVADLLAFLTFIGFAGDPGDQSNGRNVFVVKGCGKCHPDSGEEDLGPSVEQLARFASPVALAQAMWNHTTSLEERMRELEIAHTRLNHQETADLLAFLGSVRRASSTFADSLGDPRVGKVLFEKKGCAGCHRTDPGGAVHDLRKSEWYETATGMAASMWNHSSEMIRVRKDAAVDLPRFQGTEMADVLAYLYVMRSTEKIGDAARGREVFVSKHCASCHREGDAPDVVAGAANRSPAQLASAMWNHAPQMEERVKTAGLEWPTLTAEDVGDLLAYLTAAGAR